jgi:hypothetical protein
MAEAHLPESLAALSPSVSWYRLSLRGSVDLRMTHSKASIVQFPL